MLRWLFFVFIDISFFSALVGMCDCVDGSKFVYISEWIRQCKEGDIKHQFLPLLVLFSFVLMVQCQMEWMFQTACTAHESSKDDTQYDNLIDYNDYDTEELDAHVTPYITQVMTSKLACVLGAIFVFAFDYHYTSTQTALVYTHYYGVVLLSCGLLGMIHAILWQLMQAHNNHNIRGTKSKFDAVYGTSPFYTIDVVLLFSILIFFSTTLASQNTADSTTHWWSVLTEYITFILIAIEFLLICFRCSQLSDDGLIHLVYPWSRFAFIFFVLMTPVFLFQFIQVPRTCPLEYIIYDKHKTCIRCPNHFTWVNLTHCCETSVADRPLYLGSNWNWPNRIVCYTCDTEYQYCEYDYD